MPDRMVVEPLLERDLEAFFRHRIRLIGGMALKLAPTEVGMPDRLVIMPGARVYFVELKTVSGRVSPAQQALHLRLLDLGVRVHVVYGKQGVLNWIQARYPQDN